MRYIILACILLAASSLTGCSKMELNERGFILGVAIDLLEDGKIELTTQFYRPSAGKSGPGGNTSNSFINVTTSGNTVFDAVRDITIHLGRKAQWSHMQSILIGEEIAKTKTITDILDFFYRDHEPRLTTRVFITKGKASRYLDQKPYIETTVSRQMHEIQVSSSRFSGKTPDVNLLNLNLQLQNESNTAVIPYVYLQGGSNKKVVVTGGAIVKNGKMGDTIEGKNIQAYLMMKDQYESGVIVLPCKNKPSEYDSIEIIRLEATMKPVYTKNQVSVNVNITIDGSVRELACTSLDKEPDFAAYQKKAESAVVKELEGFVRQIQDAKADVLGIGGKIAQHDPESWQQLKQDWPDRFSRIRFNYKVKLLIVNSGLQGKKPVFSK